MRRRDRGSDERLYTYVTVSSGTRFRVLRPEVQQKWTEYLTKDEMRFYLALDPVEQLMICMCMDPFLALEDKMRSSQ